LPALVFLTFTFNGEFEHYASELFSLLLLSLALVTGSMPWTNKRSAIVSAALTGIIIGAMPFAKAQAIPVGALAGVMFLVAIPWRNQAARRCAVITFVCAVPVVPVLLLGAVAIRGAFGDFVMSYIRMQTNYVGGTSAPLSLALGDEHFSEFVLVSLATTLVAAALALAIGKPQPTSTVARLLPLGSIALLATCLFVMFVPHKPWTHYAFFELPPLILLVGSTLGLLYARIYGSRRKQAVIVCAAVLILVPMVRESRSAKHPYIGNITAIRSLPPSLPISIIRDLAHSGDRMAIWGLDSDLFPATGLIMGTRENSTYFQMTPTPLLAYFRERYLRDIRANRPRFFVDAVAPGFVGFTDRKTSGFETFAELAAIVRSQYQLVCDTQGIRIFQLSGSDSTNGACPQAPALMRLSEPEIARLHPIASPKAPGSIDAMFGDGTPGTSTGNVFPSSSTITVNGWAVDPNTRKPGKALIFVVDDHMRTIVSTAYGRERPDVAIALKATTAEYSGFVDAPISRTRLAPGEHTVQFGLVSADGRGLYLSGSRVPFTIR
jgi:hypothetical protein